MNDGLQIVLYDIFATVRSAINFRDIIADAFHSAMMI